MIRIYSLQMRRRGQWCSYRR